MKIAAVRLTLAAPIEGAQEGHPYYRHPICVPGEWFKDGHHFSITAEDLSDMARNFDKRKNDMVVIDYEHASEHPEVARGGAVPAAGWIHALSANGALVADIEWTPEAATLIKGGAYRFFSPAIDWAAQDKATGEAQGATLTSGALTNHPFLEELPPILLADISTGYLDQPLQTVSVAYGQSNGGSSETAPNGEKPMKSFLLKKLEGGGAGIFDGETQVGMLPHEALCHYAESELGYSKAKAEESEKKLLSELLKDSGFTLTPALSQGEREDRAAVGEGAREQIQAALKLAATHQLVEQREAARNLLLSDCLPVYGTVDAGLKGWFDTEKAKHLLRENKITAADLLDAIEAKDALSEAVAKGKVLPKDRAFFFEIALSNPKKFSEYIAGAVPVVQLASVGLGSADQVPVDQEVDIETKKLMSEKGLSYGSAMKQVLQGNAQLKERYHAAHRHQLASDSPVPERKNGPASGVTQ